MAAPRKSTQSAQSFSLSVMSRPCIRIALRTAGKLNQKLLNAAAERPDFPNVL